MFELPEGWRDVGGCLVHDGRIYVEAVVTGGDIWELPEHMRKVFWVANIWITVREGMIIKASADGVHPNLIGSSLCLGEHEFKFKHELRFEGPEPAGIAESLRVVDLTNTYPGTSRAELEAALYGGKLTRSGTVFEVSEDEEVQG